MGASDEDAQERFQRAAERFAEDLKVPAADPIVVRRSELHFALGRAIAECAQAKADLLAASKGDTVSERSMSYRGAERTLLNCLSTLVEWESSLL